MTPVNSFSDMEDLLLRLGYPETGIPYILDELDKLFTEIDFEKIKRATDTATEAKDTDGLVKSLKNLMLLLENKGYYRPDAPPRLIKLLVNGLDLKNADIFTLLEKANIPVEEKRNEQEFLASCAAITDISAFCPAEAAISFPPLKSAITRLVPAFSSLLVAFSAALNMVADIRVNISASSFACSPIRKPSLLPSASSFTPFTFFNSCRILLYISDIFPPVIIMSRISNIPST